MLLGNLRPRYVFYKGRRGCQLGRTYAKAAIATGQTRMPELGQHVDHVCYCLFDPDEPLNPPVFTSKLTNRWKQCDYVWTSHTTICVYWLKSTQLRWLVGHVC